MVDRKQSNEDSMCDEFENVKTMEELVLAFVKWIPLNNASWINETRLLGNFIETIEDVPEGTIHLISCSLDLLSTKKVRWGELYRKLSLVGWSNLGFQHGDLKHQGRSDKLEILYATSPHQAIAQNPCFNLAQLDGLLLI